MGSRGSCMGRAVRKTFPMKVSYILRLRAGKIQKLTKIPASVVHSLRKGRAHPSEATIKKLSALYDTHWLRHAVKHGARPDEAMSWLKADRPPSYIRFQEEAMLDVAKKIQQARSIRDGKQHSLADIKRQMAKNMKMTADDWLVYTKRWIREIKGVQVYKKTRILQWKRERKEFFRKKTVERQRKLAREIRKKYSIRQIEKWKRDSILLHRKRK